MAVVVASAIVLTSVTAAAADTAQTPEIPEVTVAGSISYRVADPATVPVVESEIGRGAALSTAPGSAIPLGEAVDGFSSALVRVSALKPGTDTTLFRSGGAPALQVSAQRVASTALLLPVHDGAVQLWASAPVNVRVEVLAVFQSNPSQPGSMIALDEPVLRADTATGLAASAIGAAAVPINVVGLGGVPSTQVRAVFATMVVTSDRATTITTGGQRLPVGAGRTIMTTILPLDENGAVGVSSSASQAQLQVYVSGWIPDEPAQASQVNLPGSFVVTADATDGAVADVREGSPEPALISRNADAEYSIGLVAATDASETTFLDLGEAYAGRGRGAVVDAAAGAVPQLVVTKAQNSDDVLTLRRGEASVWWAPVGDILGEEQSRPADQKPTISVDSHEDGRDIDLGAHGYFTLSGGLTTPGSAIDRVEVSGPEGLIGTADVRTDQDGTHWEFDAAAPVDGSFVYTATVYDRAGHSASDDVTIDVAAVDPDDTVTSPETYVFNEKSDQQWLHKVSDTEFAVDVEPEFGPGDVLVGAASEATPDGALVKVVAIDRVGAAWRVRVEQASLQDAFFQVDLDEVEQLDDPAKMSADDDPADVPAPTDESGQPISYPEVDYLEGDGERGWVVPEDEVDLTDVPPSPSFGEESSEESTEGSPTAEPAAFVRAGESVSASMGFQANLLVEWKDKFGTPTIQEVSKSAGSPEESKKVLESKFSESVEKESAAVALALKGQLAADLTFVLKSHFTWKWGFNPVQLVLDEITLKLVVTAKVAAQVRFSISTKKESTTWNPLASYSLPTTTFAAGPVPVVITNSLVLALKSSYGLEAKLSLPELSHKRVYTYGFTYTPSTGYETLSKDPVSTTGWGPFDGLAGTDFSATGSFSFGPEISETSKLYGIAGPEITLSGQVKVDLTAGVEKAPPKGDVPAHWRAYFQYKLALVAELAGKVKIEIWGKNLGNAKLFTFKTEAPLLAGKWTTDDLEKKPTTAAGAGTSSLSPPGQGGRAPDPTPDYLLAAAVPTPAPRSWGRLDLVV
ncbi:MAG: hypothetical protein EPO52_00040 [Herbiconiux sp.]|uniref:hypothetical protein n=1 Tax=Herbiconiux sp. TaxID=1871186 RepID=UPI0012273C3B|nr:hypothetical protein [Herbiconiux sp.]TAJ50253.1 MAG: hypothetical protein EPO52_00040 [Herbiconiux sp.]